MKRIKSFGIGQTAKVFGVMYFFISLVIMIPMGIVSTLFLSNTFDELPMGGPGFMFLMPFIYGAFAFVMTAIGCLIYNIIANWIGGVELEIDDEQVEAGYQGAEGNE